MSGKAMLVLLALHYANWPVVYAERQWEIDWLCLHGFIKTGRPWLVTEKGEKFIAYLGFVAEAGCRLL